MILEEVDNLINEGINFKPLLNSVKNMHWAKKGGLAGLGLAAATTLAAPVAGGVVSSGALGAANTATLGMLPSALQAVGLPASIPGIPATMLLGTVVKKLGNAAAGN